MLPVDLTSVLGVTLGLMTVLIPIAGFTLRFALKPIVEAMIMARNRGASRDEISILEKRIALLERELELRRLPQVTETPAVGASVPSLRSYDRT
jgi:hypothetical protein